MMMASRQALPSPVPLDTNDIDRFINYDQVAIPSPTFSPVSSRSKSLSAPTSIPNSNTRPIQPSSQPLFAPPSHQYEAYSNNNGLPVGALFEAYSVNQANQFTFGRNQPFYGTATSDGFGLNTGDDFAFTNGTGYNTYNTSDIDVDFGSTPQSLLTQPVDGLDVDFIDPSAIGGQETTPQPPKRAYPGMHQQQAALAKAQAEQKQKEMDAQKQQAATSTSRPSTQRPTGSSKRPATDPLVEEKISQLLNQMRHNSVGSSNDDDAATPTASGGNSYGSRIKKDEDEMDEDERLLASEEGKKLSSKERRQLRNKVSARAFRSRRKEYIGQLEGELAAKSAESDDLRSKNEALMKENAQLHELTRSILSSAAFQDYIKEIGGQSSDAAPPEELVMKCESTPQPTNKDVNPNSEAAQNIQSQQFDAPFIGMTMIPEQSVDLGAYESNVDSWSNNMDFSLYDQQVYAVTSIPEGPAIDQLTPTFTSDKSHPPILPFATNENTKTDAPVVERMPCVAEPLQSMIEPENSSDDDGFDESDPAFALFSDCPATTASIEAEEPIFGNIQLEKAFGRVELIVEDGSVDSSDLSSASMERFQRLCSSLDALSERISLVTPHRL